MNCKCPSKDVFWTFYTWSVLLVVAIDATFVYNRAYHYLNQKSIAPCIRRLNGSSQVGCSSDRNGNVGKIHIVRSLEDLFTWQEDVKTNGCSTSVIIAVYKKLYIQLTGYLEITKLRMSSCVKGLLIFHNSTDDYHLNKSNDRISDDSQCPNSKMSIYDDKVCSNTSDPKGSLWNEGATSAVFTDWPFPVILIINTTEIEMITNCTKVEDTYRYCAMEIKTVMFALQNSKECLRKNMHAQPFYNQVIAKSDSSRSFCNPIGDVNLLWSLRELKSNIARNDKSVVLVVSRMDSISMFQNYAPAVSTLLPSLALTLALADQLSKPSSVIHNSSKRDIAFLFLNGESWDYIGSQRVVTDMHNNKFPEGNKVVSSISLNNLHSIIEIGQLSNLQREKTSYGFLNPPSSANNDLIGIVDQFVNGSQLPPSSLHSFIKKPFGVSNQLKDISAMLITDHKDKFINKRYHSFTDVHMNITDELVSNLKKLGDNIGKYLLRFVTGSTSAFSIPKNVIYTYLECLYANNQCYKALTVLPNNSDYLKNVTLRDLSGKIGSYPSIHFKNTENLEMGNPLRFLMYHLLVAATAKNRSSKADKQTCLDTNNQGDNPQLPITYKWIDASINSLDKSWCFTTSVTTTPAVSPISIDDYAKWSHDSRYSTWTESVQSDTVIRMFAKPTWIWDTIVLVVGFVMFLLSSQFTLSIWFNLDAIFLSSSCSTMTRTKNNQPSLGSVDT